MTLALILNLILFPFNSFRYEKIYPSCKDQPPKTECYRYLGCTKTELVYCATRTVTETIYQPFWFKGERNTPTFLLNTSISIAGVVAVYLIYENRKQHENKKSKAY